MSAIFTNMIGTLAVILLVAAFIGSSELIEKRIKTEKPRRFVLFAGVLGGLFGIYGNISGFDLNGAVISVRDIGPMLAGYLGGPLSGLLAGAISAAHRLFLGGKTMYACAVATVCIGLVCGFVSQRRHRQIAKPYWAALLSAGMEAFHLAVVLAMVRPFEEALALVKQIALPFILINALGFVMMISIINYTERQRRLSLERSRMQSELEVASVIQHSLLPTIDEAYPGRSEVDVSGFMEAAKEVGGDFYDVFFVSPDRLAFVIGDVSGKGVPAALFMAVAKITLQNCIRDIPQLSAAVATANNVLCARNEADMFVTLWVGVLDLADGTLNCVSAGHNPPVLMRGGTAELLKVKNGFVLAGMEGVSYKEHTVALRRGDALFLYTDGFTEAQNAQGELFGEARLLEALRGVSDETAEARIRAATGAVESFVRGGSRFDDMTALCFRLR